MMSLNAPMRRLERGDYILCVCVCLCSQEEGKTRKQRLFHFIFLVYLIMKMPPLHCARLNNTPSAVCKRLLEYACLRVYITCLLWAELQSTHCLE